MNILLIAQFGQNGGTREAFKRILAAHHAQNHVTHVVIEPKSDEAIKRFITDKGATFTELSPRKPFFDSMFTTVFYEHLQYSSLLKTFKPDLVVASIGTVYRSLYFFVRKFPLVYLLHTIQVDLKWPIRLYFKLFSLASANNQWICGVSKAAVQSIINNWGYPEDRTAVLHNCFTKDNVSKTRERERSDQQTVLTLGHLVDYKNPGIWLKVARRVTKQFENVNFIWLGDGALYQEFSKKVKGNDRIQFPGFKQDVHNYYAEACIYFQPSRIENHSFSVLDAMANGIPCVVSNVGGQPESVQEGSNGFLCEPDQIECYVRKISDLLEDSSLRHEMGKKGKRVALNNFNPDDYNEKLFNLYKRVMNERKSIV